MTMTALSNADLGALRVHARATSSETAALVRFAHDVRPTLPAQDLERRLGSHPIVWTASRGAQLCAFQLVDVRIVSGVRLVYLGPVFSRDGGYASIFEALVGAELAREHPFCLGMELDDDDAERRFRRLLPTATRPGPSGHVPVDERVLARWFAKTFDAIVGLDDDTLQTQRSSLLLVPCLEEDDRDALRAELARGMASFRRQRTRRAG